MKPSRRTAILWDLASDPEIGHSEFEYIQNKITRKLGNIETTICYSRYARPDLNVELKLHD